MKSLPFKSKWLLMLFCLQILSVSLFSQTKKIHFNHVEKSAKKSALNDVPFKQRLKNGGINLKGDISMIANSIVSKHQDGTISNDNYSGSESNGLINMEYIDVDNDPSTFSSSSAKLNLPKCSKIEYAGLYWSAVYSVKRWGDTIKRENNFDEIKFKLPGQNYTDIKGEIVYDDGVPESKPYLCYQDITSLLQSQNSPNGDYTAANIKATVGKDKRGLGSSGGWIMVVIYKDETQPSRRISIFDGFSSVGNGATVDVSYSGFTTIPIGPVKAKMLVGALEGDKSISGDRFKIKDVNNNYQNLETTLLNPNNNFFNGTITINDAHFTDRTPNSENTLGFDADLFSLNNTNNELITNNQTEADLRFTSKGDVYWVFLNAMSIDIIEPNVELIKTIDDGNGNNIAGNPVDLGNELWYNIAFQNKGNDDAINTVLVDKLPKNVDLSETDIQVPVGVTYTYDPPAVVNDFRGILTFTIPDSLVEKGASVNNIRLKVTIVDDCNQLRGVCSNRISNQAFVSYKGKTSGIEINEDPSFSGVDNCNNGEVGPSNFLVDVSGCTYERAEILCSESILLTAGRGYLSYEWKDQNGNVIGNTQSITVFKTGRYTVNKVAPVGCINTSEIINVQYINNQPNPLLAFADNIKTCPTDKTKLAEIYLCSNSSTSEIITNYPSTTTVTWQKLEEGSCTPVNNSNCANKNDSCTWNTIKSGNNFSATSVGKYRLEIKLSNGCFNRFYFNVVEVILDPQIITQDIVCETPGSITINSIPEGYEYSLTNIINSYQDSNKFSISTSGSYKVYIRKKRNSSSISCVYTFPLVEIQKKEIEVLLTTKEITCSNSEGEIKAIVNNVNGPYTYKLYKNNTLIKIIDSKVSNTQVFSITDSGTYTVEVTTSDNCIFSEDKEFIKPDPLNIEAKTVRDIDCVSGEIELSSEGGTPNYKYAIWSYNEVDLYNSISDIPNSEFFISTTVEIPKSKNGKYRFVLVDAKNCYSISNVTTINQEQELDFTENVKDVNCFNEKNGSIEVKVNGNSLNYTIQYSINDGLNYQNTGLFENLAKGNYKVKIKAVKNGNTCFYNKDLVISQPDKISAVANLTKDYTCDTKGEITFLTPTGGKAPYKFSVDNINFFSKNVFENLTNGIYKPTVKDANNCIIQLPNIVIDSLPLAPDFKATITYDCKGLGTAVITPFNTLYTYSINGSIYTSNNVFNSLPAGDHIVRINYGKECLVSETITVLPNKEFSGEIKNIVDVSCNSDTNGSFTISAHNYLSSFEYSINNGVWETATNNSVLITNLSKGTYSVKIKTATCNLDLGNIIINEPPKLSVSSSVTTPFSCVNNGATITPIGQGGSAPYTFSIDNGVTWKTSFTNVAAGTYKVIVKDSNNCTAEELTTVEVKVPKEILFTANTTKCFTGNNGEITVNVTQGNGLYQFSIDNGSWVLADTATPNSYTFRNLTAKTYDIKVKDGLGCESKTKTYRINPQLTADITVKDISCNYGEIKVSSNGGGGNYVYAIIKEGSVVTNSDFGSSNNQPITEVGNYDVYVRDNSGNSEYCEFKQSVYVTKLPELVLETSKTNPKCFNGEGKLELTINGGLAPYTISINGSSGYTETTSPFTGSKKEYTNLSVGEYTIQVTSKDNCTKTITAKINNAKELKAIIKPLVPTCEETDSSNYGFEFEVTENYQPYKLEFSADNGVSWSSEPIFKGISSGTEVFPVIRLLEEDNISVRCVKVLEPYTIPFLITNLETNVSVVENCIDGIGVLVEVKNGFGPFQFAVNSTTNWQNPSAANPTQFEFSNLIPGLSYVFYTKDATGCIKQNEIDIYENYTPIVQINGKVVNNTCATNNSGKIEFSFNDPTNILIGEIKWKLINKTTNTVVRNGNQIGTSAILVTNLDSGDYYLIVENSESCAWGSLDVTIEKGTAINGTISKVRDIACNLPGVIEVDAISGGFSPYTFTLTSTNFINPIVGNTYSIEIPYSNLIDTTLSSTIFVKATGSSSCKAQLGSLVLSVTKKPEIEDVIVNNCGVNKSITIKGVKGKAPYFYSIDNGVTYQENEVFENLNPNTYSVKIKDSNGCISNSKLIEVFPPLEIEVSNSNEFECSSAKIVIDVKNGSGNYDFEIKNSANVNVFTRTNLDVNPKEISLSNSDTYTVIVYDNKTSTPTCFKSTDISVDVPKPIEFTSPITIKNNTCFGANNGSITINASGGTGDLSYSIDQINFTETNTFSNLSEGNYSVTVKDEKGCSINQIVKIKSPLKLTVAIVNLKEETCFNSNNASFNIEVSGGSAPYYIKIDDGNYKKNQFEFTNLTGGKTYVVSVRDKNNCETNVSVVINKTEQLKVETYNVYQQVCAFEEGSNSFKIKVTGGKEPYKTKIGNGPYIESQFSFNNLTNGEQIVFIKDKNNCEISIKVPISKPIDLKLSLNTTIDCNGLGVITANVEDEYKDDNLVYTLNGTINQSTSVFNNLTEGKYIIQVKHPKGCIDTKEIEVENIEPLTIEVDTSTLNAIIIDAYGGEPSYTYSIDGKNFQSDNTFLIGESKSYNIIVRDSRGCEVSEVIKGEYVTISIPNFFTPNNDGKNDFWYPEKVQTYHQIKVFIYDRYSRLLKTYNGIQTGWNGSYNNKPLPSGDYWYVVHYKEIFGDQKKLIGNFTLYR